MTSGLRCTGHLVGNRDAPRAWARATSTSCVAIGRSARGDRMGLALAVDALFSICGEKRTR
jgi:hypothetical protein